MINGSIAVPSASPDRASGMCAFRARIRRFRWLFLPLGALLCGLCVAFPQAGILEWVALVPSLWVIFTLIPDPHVRLRRLYGMGFVFFETYYLVNFHWFLYMYPLEFAGLSKGASLAVVLVAWLGLSAFQAVGAAFLFVIMGFATRGDWLRRRSLLHPVLFASLWTAWEWFQANSGFTGVPWGRLPLGQAHFLPALQSASLFGSYVVSFLILMVNGLVAYAILHATKRMLCTITAVSLFAANILYGVAYMGVQKHHRATDTARPPVKVAAIQGNISSHEKWTPTALNHAMEVYGEESRKAASAGAELIVWPETAIPASVDQSGAIRHYLSDLGKECGVPILAGVFTDGDGGDYNSIVAVLPDGTFHETRYHKRNLVPFGEFVPWRDLVMTLIPPLGELGMLDEDLLAGTEPRVFDFDLPGFTGQVGSLVCFDSIYERNSLEAVRDGAELLAVSTNDSWFKDSSGVWMHNAQSQLRAIETGRYVVRAANTGVSSVITSTGEITSELGPFLTGAVIDEIRFESGRTLYAVIGNTFAYLCLAWIAALSILPIIQRICRRIQSKKRD